MYLINSLEGRGGGVMIKRKGGGEQGREGGRRQGEGNDRLYNTIICGGSIIDINSYTVHI